MVGIRFAQICICKFALQICANLQGGATKSKLGVQFRANLQDHGGKVKVVDFSAPSCLRLAIHCPET